VAGIALNAESEGFHDADFGRGMMTADWDEEPTSPAARYNMLAGFNVPGDSVDFADYRLVTPEQSFKIPVGYRTIRFGLQVTPQQTLSYWTIAAAEAIRLATAVNGDPLVLCVTPHSVQRFSIASQVLSTLTDLSTLASAPVDMAAANSKVYVAYADKVLVIDEDDGELAYELLLPWPDEVSAVTALAVSDGTLYVASTLAAGGSRLYSFADDTAEVASDLAGANITALADLDGTVYAGTDAGNVYTLSSSGLSLAYATGATLIARFGINVAALYAGTGNLGKLFSKVASWTEAEDFGWTAVYGLSVLNDRVYAGGTGSGGSYLWQEGDSGWIQAVLLAGVTAVNDLGTYEDQGAQQLFAATTAGGATCELCRIEVAEEAGRVVGSLPPDLSWKITQET